MSAARELWDVYDSAGIRTGRLIERTAAMPKGDFHLAAELWLSDVDHALLLQQRAASRKILPGIWTMTTGCMLTGEDSLVGVLREAHEELGLSLPPHSLVLLERIIRPEVGTIWDIWSARIAQRAPALMLDPAEVADARWVTPDTLRALMRTGGIYTYPEMDELLSRWERLR